MCARVRDLEYEEANRAYEWQSSADGYKCKNYALCKDILPHWWFDCKGRYICTNCDILLGELPYREALEDCSVCFGTEHKQVEFPAACGHWFCTECTRNIIGFGKDDSEYCLSPVPYGCPPCPKGCANPERGKQCNCSEYNDVFERWKTDHPSQYEEWNRHEMLSIEIAEGSVKGSGICPLCRTKWKHATCDE